MPLLVLHGAYDTNVPVIEAEQTISPDPAVGSVAAQI